MTEKGSLSNRVLGGKYQLGDLLGEGGFGAVYKAMNRSLNRPQAIKVLLDKHLRDPKFHQRFIREAQTLAALDHPHIVHVDELGEEPDLIYLVMPYLSGGTLQHRLKARTGPLGLEEVLRSLEHICSALGYAHAQGVVHLDLKPLNLLVHQDGRLLLSDFGLAHLMEQGAIEGGTSLQFGSPLYMAPEHFEGKPSQRSDLYALGVILYQMLAGRHPFEASTPAAVMRKHLTEPPPSLHAARPDRRWRWMRCWGKLWRSSRSSAMGARANCCSTCGLPWGADATVCERGRADAAGAAGSCPHVVCDESAARSAEADP